MESHAHHTQDLGSQPGTVTQMTQPATATPPVTGRRAHIGRSNALRYAVVGAVALVVFLVAWIVLRGGGDSAGTSAAPGPARLASTDELKSFASGLDHPVYWAGPREDTSYELTRTADGRVYVRYLPVGTQAGDPRATFLTVGTYPRATAFAELKRAAKTKGSVSVELPRGGLMVFSQSRPTSVYVGYPEGKYQVEVYAPSADAARRAVLSGQVRPVR